MNCIIVDDDKMARMALKALVSDISFLTLKHECDTAISAFNTLQREQIDLVFLDIEMPEMSGLELLKNLERRPIVVFCTAKEEYAVEAFELNVADYIVKPYTKARFLAAVSRAKEIFDSKQQQVETLEKEYIFIRTNSVLTKIIISEISYIQALGDYINIFTDDKRHTVHMTLKAIEDKLLSEKFYRLHRSYLINLDKIDSVEKETAYINKHPIPIGEQNKQELLKRLNLI
ncbi:MAG: transcriptional regulator [Bacteroidetes bacterium]|jgi:DNA-binding LytR/AlgR family response regulator|nr:transcriptional regulator [Bacteroidota bacterium]